jgi:hypothetical protein
MYHVRRTSIIFAELCLILLLLPGCDQGPEAQIEERLEELVEALNAHDVAAASRLFKGGEIPPVNNIGDSSVFYRLLHIPGNEDLDIVGVTATTIDDRARADVELRGNVVRGDSVVGEMTLPLEVDLERSPAGVWMILP